MRRILYVLLALAMLTGLGGCARQPQRQSVTWFDLFDTVTIPRPRSASRPRPSTRIWSTTTACSISTTPTRA